ncbi:MAG: hypothetical protein RLZZ28_2364 [Bacteroidota bacterium]|jgi:hypothetical protein
MKKSVLLFTIFILCVYSSAIAQEPKAPPKNDAAELAKKLANPVASLISVPFQNNTDLGIGPNNGYRNTLNFQPVVPINLTKKVNLISRLVLPIITQRDVAGLGTKQTGLSDAVVSAFFSPSEAKNGLIWGAGPVFLIPIATDNLLGTQKFGVGPTALVLKQTNGWTIGALANQLWSIAGNASRSDLSQLFLQPFLNYNWKSGAGMGISSEITQNWQGNSTTAFIIPSVSGVTKLGTQIVSLAIGPRIPVSAPINSGADFGIRASIVFVFPK